MPRLDEVSLSILNRMIEQRAAQLRTAELGNNAHLASKLRSEIRGLRAGLSKRERGAGGPLWVRPRREPQRPVRRSSRTSARRPTLKDDATVVDPHGARWEALTAYIRKLNQSFPGQDLTGMAGFFSTEREFARHIRAIESRLPKRGRRTRSKPAARKATRRKTATRRSGRSRR
jgi:hypothetical protein